MRDAFFMQELCSQHAAVFVVRTYKKPQVVQAVEAETDGRIIVVV